MINAKEEILKLLNGKEIKCAIVNCEPTFLFTLKVGHTSEEYVQFLDKLDFEYAVGFGLYPIVFGTIWFKDGTWAERIDYDGYCSWAIRTSPEIPEYLKKEVITVTEEQQKQKGNGVLPCVSGSASFDDVRRIWNAAEKWVMHEIGEICKGDVDYEEDVPDLETYYERHYS